MTDAQLPPLRILWVEDNPENRKLVFAMLVRRGHTVDCAENGRQAISMLIEDEYDVLLMDIFMPEMDGVEAANVIRSSVTDKVDSSIPIIVLTAHASEEERHRYLQAGIDAVLSKPVRVAVLLKTLQDVLAHKGILHVCEGSAVAQPCSGRLRGIEEISREFGLERSDVLELYQSIVLSLPREFSALKVATREGWWEEVGELAHTMSGSVLDVVAEGPSMISREIEHAVKNGGEHSVSALCDELEVQLEKVMQQLTVAMSGM